MGAVVSDECQNYIEAGFLDDELIISTTET